MSSRIRFRKYRNASGQVERIFNIYTPLIGI
jgi:hypothetical protein